VILLLKNKAVLVIDRVEVPHVALVESRMHTFHKVAFGAHDASIKGKREKLHVSYSATQETLLKEGKGLQTHPRTEGDTILRQVSAGKVFEITLCTLMVPNGRGSVSVTERGTRTHVKTEGTVPVTLSFGSKGLSF